MCLCILGGGLFGAFAEETTQGSVNEVSEEALNNREEALGPRRGRGGAAAELQSASEFYAKRIERTNERFVSQHSRLTDHHKTLFARKDEKGI